MSEIENYQHEFKDILFPIYHNDYHKNEGDKDRYVAYSIKDDRFRNFLHYWYTFQTSQDFDFNWYKECNAYIATLDPTDKYRLRCYSHVSDEVVNSFIRNPDGFSETFPIQLLQKMEAEHLYFFMPDLMEEEGVEIQWDSNGILPESARDLARTLMHTHISNNIPRLVSLISRYVDHVRRILRNAPRPSRDILVFRGVKSDYLKDEEPGMFRGFCSTTWYPQVAYLFGEDNNMIYEFRVSRATPALCIHSLSVHDEYEVLLDTDIYGVADRLYEKYYLDLYRGDGEFPAVHIWNPTYTDVKGTPKRITIRSRIVMVQPEGFQGGFVKNRTVRNLQSRSIKTYSRSKPSIKPAKSRKSIRSTHSKFKMSYDPRDPTSPAFVPTSGPFPRQLLQDLHKYQQSNPRNKRKTHGK